MSEQSQKNAISVYLSPKASDVLKGYVENSGFGSVSRTVEEIILAYDKIYDVYLSGLQVSKGKLFSQSELMLMTFFMIANNLELLKGTENERLARIALANSGNQK